MTSDSAKIVPFGKYKGHTVERMAEDRQYCEWLMAQPWFRDKFRDVYNIVINNGEEPQDTPEHNALQALFLEDDWCLAFIRCAIGADETDAEIVLNKERRRREDIIEKCTHGLPEIDARQRLKALPDFVDAANVWKNISTTFEQRGIDVTLEWELMVSRCLLSGGTFHIEIKPVVGDDYPSVLRQMRNSGARFLFLQHYNGEGVTTWQFRKMFEKSGITVVFRSEVEKEYQRLRQPLASIPSTDESDL